MRDERWGKQEKGRGRLGLEIREHLLLVGDRAAGG
jgi:hypothetical protein